MRSVTLLVVAGLATAAHAQDEWSSKQYPLPPEHANLKTLDATPVRSAGVLYINLVTGDHTLTRYHAPDGAALVSEIPAVGMSDTGIALFDYWMALDLNPCWDNPLADGFAWNADSPRDATLDMPITEPVIGFDFGDLPFDSVISGLILKTSTLATESTDSNGDGVLDAGIDTIAAFYDGLSEQNRTSVSPPTAVVRVESIPGRPATNPDQPLAIFEVIVDFGGAHFELGDSDGLNLGALWMDGARPGLDVSDIVSTSSGGTVSHPSPDGLADFQYLQHYAQYGSNDKVTADSTFIGVATAEGLVVFETFTTSTSTVSTTSQGVVTTTTYTITVTETYLVPDPLPQGNSAYEGFGIAALGTGADYSDTDWSIGGCCYWFGGVDCAGFLDQVDPNTPFSPTWYFFAPYAQNAMGLLSDAPPSDCARIDFATDGVLDNADIRAFVDSFLFPYTEHVPREDLPDLPTQTADMNQDGVIDNGDIPVFVQTFLACTG